MKLREVVCIVEDKVSEVSACNVNSSVHSHNLSWIQIVVRRLGFWLNRLKAAYRFLTFNEPDPKHKVWETITPEQLGLVVTSASMLAVSFVVVSGLRYGVLGFFAAYAIVIILALEIPHVVFDR